jgi:PAS domain S-box-containing protein
MDGHILFANPTLIRLLGEKSADECLGKHFPTAYYPPLMARKLQKEVMPALLRDGHWHGELELVTADGRRVPTDENFFIIRDKQGQPRYIADILTDITERKQIERQMLRTQRLESIGTLAGGIAHDLNNALAPIIISVEMLRSEYPLETQMLEIIQTSTKRAADMVKQLLTFAKGAEGMRTPLQLGRLVKEMKKIMEGSFPKNLKLKVQCDPKLPTVLGEATQLHQVLMNLCVNARDAMPHGGTLTLEAMSQMVDATYASSVPDAKPGDYVALRVRDTGTGIPPEIIDRIFEPFFTTKGPDKGTGLGLSTVMGIIKGHDGFLQVQSQPGQGSTFTAFLPVHSAGSDTEHIIKAAAGFRGQGETILIVEDDDSVRKVVCAVLRRLNFNPLAATDGADGLLRALENRAELRAVITDLHMPHMDGLAFVRALRRMLPDIPVAVASGRMEEAMAEELKTLGVTCWLTKPFTEPELAETLKTFFAPK